MFFVPSGLVGLSHYMQEAKERGKTIADVCKALGYYRDHINKMQNPSAGKLIDIAHAIGCTPAELFDGL